MPFVNQFVEHCSFIRHNGQYIVHSQVFPAATGAAPTPRAAPRAAARAWLARPMISTVGPTCGNGRSRCPSRPTTRCGAPAHRGDASARMTRCISASAPPASATSAWGSTASGTTHRRPGFQRDLLRPGTGGLQRRRPFPRAGREPGHVFIHRDDSPATPVPGHNFNTILCQGNGILNVGDETRIYHGRWRNAGQKAEDITAYYCAEVALATLPRDRWGAGAQPRRGTGAICSAPVTFPADSCELRLNADGGAGLSVDLLDERMQPIPGFSGGRIAGPDGLDCPVRWAGHAPAELAGQAVRVRVNLEQKAETRPRSVRDLHRKGKDDIRYRMTGRIL